MNNGMIYCWSSSSLITEFRLPFLCLALEDGGSNFGFSALLLAIVGAGFPETGFAKDEELEKQSST
jgi:hypothetical protein